MTTTNFRIVHASEWPGKLQPGSGRYQSNDLYLAIEDLVVDGDIIKHECDDAELARIRSRLGYVARTQEAQANGWQFETTYQGGVLYIRKVAITE